MARPIRGQPYTLDVSLGDSANRPYYRTNPTIVADDVRVQQDDGPLLPLASVPVVRPVGGPIVQVSLNQYEMQARQVTVVFHDASGGEWDDLVVVLRTEESQGG